MGYIFGLIGYPAKHSRSPWIHHHFLEQQHESGVYRIFETSPADLQSTLASMKQLQIDGFNVTVPYKEDILQYLDKLDPYAKKVGAVNTVLYQDGEWIGYNTDGKGFVRSLLEAYPNVDLSSSKALCIGAGGAARGIYTALLEEDMQRVDIANRTPERANTIVELNDQEIPSRAISLGEAEKSLEQYDIIVQTTSVGMPPNDHQQIISLTNVKKGAIVADIVYKPFETIFLQDAKQKGAHILHGHGMLIYQAALAYEKWTNTTIQADELLGKFEQQLKGDDAC
ncbi:shikimate dehydrogenase [Pontibacillus yanchengensis]|uniref:Shikimate dehydrogenase n=2 Tax=Pontibacillus yanchengensis TaxID=462910 RepID=A0ACC7VF83_9BACI|nr:shikimate dehydrogenase [Pontibacillus yanchengensis]MYL33397.1 shikimate dehydrogenase [Pontibacillus yanchengensis]MYL53447.1 shikimate dehydrogenase [Pontibacillus yanchengensis]